MQISKRSLQLELVVGRHVFNQHFMLSKHFVSVFIPLNSVQFQTSAPFSEEHKFFRSRISFVKLTLNFLILTSYLGNFVFKISQLFLFLNAEPSVLLLHIRDLS